MPTLVSTGQFTIVDNNDAKPISAAISANASVQQVYTKSNGIVTYSPDSYAVDLVLTPKIYVGATGGTATDISSNTSAVTNRKWGKTVGSGNIYTGGSTTQDTTSFVQTDGTTAATAPFTVSTNGVTLTIKGNLISTLSTYPIYFEFDYTDPATSLTSHIVADITLSKVDTGSNAVYITIRGITAIESATGTTKNSVPIVADLIRTSGIDRGNLTYKWYIINSGTASQISTSYVSYATLFAISDTATTAVPVASTTNGTNVPTSGSGSAYNSVGVGTGNTLSINEAAVQDIQVFRVDITDSLESGTTYSTYFTISDFSDPYQVNIISSSGDKLQNGIGSTTLTPDVFYGDTQISSFTGWTFDWVFYDKNGKRAAFVDPDSNTSATSYYNAGAGRAISANTAVTPYTVTHAAISPAITLASNDIVKIIKSDGTVLYYEVTGTPTTTTVQLKETGLANLSLTDYPLPTVNAFAGGIIYLCTKSGTRTGSSIVVRGVDIDTKGRITCAANRP